MKINNVKSWAPTGAARWWMTLAICALAFCVRMSVHPIVDGRFPLLAFTLSTLYVHYRYGLGPALLSAAIGFPVGVYFFMPPFGEFGVMGVEDLLTAGAYGLLTAAFIVIIQRLRRAQYRAELLAEVAESRYMMLLQSDNERDAAERALKELHRA